MGTGAVGDGGYCWSIKWAKKGVRRGHSTYRWATVVTCARKCWIWKIYNIESNATRHWKEIIHLWGSSSDNFWSEILHSSLRTRQGSTIAHTLWRNFTEVIHIDKRTRISVSAYYWEQGMVWPLQKIGICSEQDSVQQQHTYPTDGGLLSCHSPLLHERRSR